ncbi:MAG: alpha/beta fold hydrolase [Steroidobacteraceae bacterium]
MTAAALVLAPGLMCDAAVWRAQIAAFERQMPIQVIDHGLLDSLPAMAEHLLAQAPARFALAGHSMGGRVALEVMRQAPERVTHLALLDTGCHALPAGEAAGKERALRLGFLQLAQDKGVAMMARSWLRNMVHPERLSDVALIDSIVNMFARKSVEIYAAQIKALLARPEAFPLLAGIRCPTLVLSGNEDMNSPPAVNHEMAAAIAGAQLELVPDCGHMSLLEQPEAVNAALQRCFAL